MNSALEIVIWHYQVKPYFDQIRAGIHRLTQRGLISDIEIAELREQAHQVVVGLESATIPHSVAALHELVKAAAHQYQTALGALAIGDHEGYVRTLDTAIPNLVEAMRLTNETLVGHEPLAVEQQEQVAQEPPPVQKEQQRVDGRPHAYPHQIGLRALRLLQGAMFYASFTDIAVGQYMRRHKEEAYLSVRDEMLRGGSSKDTFELGWDCFREYLEILPNPVFQASLFAMRTSWDWYLRRLVGFVTFARSHLGEPALTGQTGKQWSGATKLSIRKQLLLLEHVSGCTFGIAGEAVVNAEEMTLVRNLGIHHHWEIDDTYLRLTSHSEKWRLGQIRGFAGGDLLVWRTALDEILSSTSRTIAQRYWEVPTYKR